jgi:hypothetical protein
MKYKTTAFILVCSVVGFTVGIPLGNVLSSKLQSRYSRWEELSVWEREFLVDCVLEQPYSTCIENVHEMRQIGIVPVNTYEVQGCISQ